MKLRIASFFRSSLLVALMGVALPMAAQAAQLFFEPPQLTLPPRQTFQVHLLLDAQPDDVNALEGRVVFPADALELKEIRDANSMVSLWVERPHAVAGSIRFSGIIPGGVRSPKGEVFTLLFETKQPASGSVALQDVRVLRNDGKGTPVDTRLSPFRFLVSASAPSVPPPPAIHDTVPPEPFTPVVTRDPDLFEGKWFAVFATQDKGSGIDRYEIQEALEPGRGAWIVAQSPYVLQDQERKSTILVKAVDKSGNERVETVSPLVPPIKAYAAYVILLLGALAVVLILLNRVNKKNQRS